MDTAEYPSLLEKKMPGSEAKKCQRAKKSQKRKGGGGGGYKYQHGALHRQQRVATTAHIPHFFRPFSGLFRDLPLPAKLLHHSSTHKFFCCCKSIAATPIHHGIGWRHWRCSHEHAGCDLCDLGVRPLPPGHALWQVVWRKHGRRGDWFGQTSIRAQR